MRNFTEFVSSNKPSNRRLFLSIVIVALFAAANSFVRQPSAQMQIVKSGDAIPQLPTNINGLNPQPAILTTTDASNRVVVFPDPENAPAVQNLVSGLPADARPHGISFIDGDNALVADWNNSRVFVVRLSTASLVSTIPTGSYDGGGTIAVAPNRTAALAISSSNQLYKIQAPFNQNSIVTHITLPDAGFARQTQAVVFDNAGRAFVYHTNGISVLNAPYTSVAFTILNVFNRNGGAIAISPDGNTLLTTPFFRGGSVSVYQAPFAAETFATGISVPVSDGFGGIAITPDGANAIVPPIGFRGAFGIAAPFGSSSVISRIPFPANDSRNGFDNISISADSQMAILTGNSITDPAFLVKAPFNAAAVVSDLPIAGVSNPARGNGAVRFLSAPNGTPTPTPETSCTPIVTITDDPTLPGGLGQFTATRGAGSITVDGANSPTGLRTLTLVSQTNAVVNIPAFTPGTTAPVVVTFAVVNPNLPVDIRLRATGVYHGVLISAACPCVPTTIVTDDPTLPGGLNQFAVTPGINSITIDPIESGTGLRVFTVVSQTNAMVSTPPFVPGTFAPITVTYSITDPALPVDITLRAASLYHGVIIRLRCGMPPTNEPEK